MEKKNLMTVKELINYLSISESTVRKLMDRKEIPHIRIYNKILFEKEVIDNWLETERTVKANRYAMGTHAIAKMTIGTQNGKV